MLRKLNFKHHCIQWLQVKSRIAAYNWSVVTFCITCKSESIAYSVQFLLYKISGKPSTVIEGSGA